MPKAGIGVAYPSNGRKARVAIGSNRRSEKWLDAKSHSTSEVGVGGMHKSKCNGTVLEDFLKGCDRIWFTC